MRKIYTLLFLLLVAHLATSQITITDADLVADNDYVWNADDEIILDGYVFLESGATLTIMPGTVIKGKALPSTGDNASALIISQGAQILASGTSSSPIIFTSELDDLSNNSELTSDDKGLWGGLIILGEAVVGVDGGSENIEGIPSTEGRAMYGGTNNDDNSGVLQYVSIRHAGTALEANNEINGLTLGGVGRGTKIEYIEVFANKDDGIEWFGGAVNVKNAVVSFCGDDSFDFDQSWDGKGQFWFSIQDEESNRAGEWDGSEASDLTPSVIFQLSNATFIGGGDSSEHEDGNDALRIRDAAAAKVYNSIMIDFADRAIRLDDDFTGDSFDRLVDGDIEFKNNVLWDFGAGTTVAEITKTGDDQQPLIDAVENGGNLLIDPIIGGISRQPDGGLDPRCGEWDVLTGATDLEDEFFEDVNYIGAFGTDNWAKGWTALDAYGYFGNLFSSNKSTQIDVEVLDVYPNPFNTQINVDFNLDAKAVVAIEVYTINGQLIESVSSTLTAGAHTSTIELNQLNAGNYIVALKENNVLTAVQQIVKK